MIDSDTSRCHGKDAEPTCRDCARRLQIPKDDPNRWFPYMGYAVCRGICVYKIPAKDTP